MSIASEVTVERQGKELASSTLKPHFLYQHIISKAHERLMTSKFEAERSKRKTRSKKRGDKGGMKTGDVPPPQGEEIPWEKLVYWWWLYTEEDIFSRFCKGRWLENNFSRSWCVQQIKPSCSFSTWSKPKLTTALGEWKLNLVIPWLGVHPYLLERGLVCSLHMRMVSCSCCTLWG